MAHPLLDMLRKLKATNGKIEASVAAREQMLDKRAAIENGDYAASDTPQGLEDSLDRLPSMLKPGNAGALDRVIWPFWFPFTGSEIGPNQSTLSTMTVTQEAAFIWMSMTKVVYLRETAPDRITYLDPELPAGTGLTPGLFYSLRDAQSTRQFVQQPVALDHVGRPQFPTVLPTPQIFLPNSTIEIEWFNNHTANTYLPIMVFFGYRVRWDGSKDLLSTIYG